MTLADCNLDGASILVFTLMHLQLLNVTRGTPPFPPSPPAPPPDQITIRCLRWPARPLCDIAIPWSLGPSSGLFFNALNNPIARVYSIGIISGISLDLFMLGADLLLSDCCAKIFK